MPKTKKENLVDTKPGDEEELESFPEEERPVETIEEPFFPEEEKAEFPEEEDRGDVPIINEEGFSNEELPEEEKEAEFIGEQPPLDEEEKQAFLFEGDKVFNALQAALTDVNEELKKIEKLIDNKRLEKSVLIGKKEEFQEALKIYEEQRTDKE